MEVKENSYKGFEPSLWLFQTESIDFKNMLFYGKKSSWIGGTIEEVRRENPSCKNFTIDLKVKCGSHIIGMLMFDLGFNRDVIELHMNFGTLDLRTQFKVAQPLLSPLTV